MARFTDRATAGAELAAVLARRHRGTDTLVLALPRGGVPVAAAIARALGCEFDVVTVRKLGAPRQPELAVGAVASGGAIVINDEVLRAAGVRAGELERISAAERAELDRREAVYREGRAAPGVAGRDVWIVDDGIATGATVRAAVGAVRSRRPRSVMVATPVAPAGTAESLADVADDIVVLHQPRHFGAVGRHYERFAQLTDDDVTRALRGSAGPGGTGD